MEIDRIILQIFNGSDSLFLDRFVVTLTHGLSWVPMYIVLAILIIKNNKTMSQILLIFGCGIVGVLLSGVLSDLIIKPIVMRPRPFNDPEWSEMVKTVSGYHASGYSFFSSHAANTFSLAVFFSLLVRSKLLSFTLISWSLFNAWTRLYLGVHWFTDVMTGLTWGAIVAFAMYSLYRYVFYHISPKVKYVSSKYTSTGYAYTDIYACVCIVVFTFLFGIFRAVIVI